MTVLGLLASWDSPEGLKSLLMDPECPSPLLFPLSSIITLCKLSPLDRGLRQIGESWPSTPTGSVLDLGLHFPEEVVEDVLIWLFGVSGTDRTRSGEEGRRFSRSPRTLLFKGDLGRGLNVEASASLTLGSVFVTTGPVTHNFVEDKTSRWCWQEKKDEILLRPSGKALVFFSLVLFMVTVDKLHAVVYFYLCFRLFPVSSLCGLTECCQETASITVTSDTRCAEIISVKTPDGS